MYIWFPSYFSRHHAVIILMIVYNKNNSTKFNFRYFLFAYFLQTVHFNVLKIPRVNDIKNRKKKLSIQNRTYSHLTYTYLCNLQPS